MEKKLLLIICAVFIYFLDSTSCIRWLSLHHSTLHWNISSFNPSPGRGIRSGIRSPCSIARRRYGLVKLQAKLCRKSMETMPHVQTAAELALETCENVFQHRRWNCSSAETAPYLTPDLTRATREQAYVYAISSAALTYTMARACSSGALYHCTCAGHPKDPPDANFKWGGCGDNLKWGMQFVKRFLDTTEKNVNKMPLAGKSIRKNDIEVIDEEKIKMTKVQMAAVNLHNNKIGRKVISESLITQCKCHGVSGSCSIKTCWRSLPQMVEIGKRLLKRYTNARDVSKNFVLTDTTTLPEILIRKSPVKEQLVYLTRSPDYCTKDVKLGSFGTVGRKCNVTSNGTDSCRQLCCGRGYRTVVEEKIERCQCKYYYCCYVKCKICRTLTQTHECS